MTIAVEPRPTPAETAPSEGAGPAVEHRIITVIAAASLVPAASTTWTGTVATSPRLGTAFGLVFPVLLGVIALALGARRRRTLAALDIVLVLTALAAVALQLRPMLRRPHYVIDESVLMARAIEAVAHGHNPYVGSWPADVARAPTLLFDGTNPARFGYPPLTAELGGGLAHVVGVSRAPVVLSTLALLVTVGILLRLLPVSRRGLIVPATVTISVFPFIAALAYPAAVMLPLLIIACHRPARVGIGGVLGRRGVVQAVALGLAAAAQQLAWFVVPFLLVAIWRARRGELDRGPAAAVALRFAGIGAVAFAVVNLPYVVAGPRLWLRGIADPLLQHATFNGPGLPNISLRLLGGGGQLAYWSAAGAVVFLVLLACVAFWPRLLGAGIVALPFIALWMSLRSQTIYYLTALPLLIAAVGVHRGRSDFAAARGLRLGRMPRVVVPAFGMVIALAFVVAAAATPAPLTVRVVAYGLSPRTGHVMTLTLRLRNRSDHAVTPHVFLDRGAKFTLFLRRVSGPVTLGPGGSGVLVLAPSLARPVIANFRSVYVVSDNPQTLSSVRLPRLR